jgi:CBS domain-containing protein
VRLTDLARNLPVVTRSTTALEAARRIAGDRLSALVVARDGGRPELVVPAVDVLGLLIPRYLREDTRLAAVLDDAAADELWSAADRRTIGELLDSEDVRIYDILVVDPDATLVEVATLMAATHTSIAMLDETDVDEPRFITLPTVMDAALTARDAARDVQA